jgi:tetratricopeptide (TPR) repeat protein
MGTLAQQTGRIDVAITLLTRAIKHNPRTPLYRLALGDARLAEGRLTDAAACYQKALALDKRNAEAHLGLGNVLHARHKFTGAIKHYREAIAVNPDLAEAHNNLGVVLTAVGWPADAADHFVRALELRPDFADAHLNLGRAHKAEARLNDAIASYRKALILDPNLAEAHSNLGNAHRQMGNVKAALESYRLAVKIDPTLVQAHYNLGIIKLEQGHLEDSLEDLQRAVGLAPDHVEAITNIGEVLEALGQNEEASAWYRKVIDIRVDRSLPIMGQRSRHFALGRILDRLGEFDTAFTHFKLANDIWLEHLRRTSGSYSAAASESLIGAIIAAFPLGAMAEGGIKGNLSRRPVFVLGMPRSGTTLVEQILASHSEVHGAGELPDIPQIAERISTEGAWTDAVRSLDTDQAEVICGKYMEKLHNIAPGARRVVNKLPMNFLYLGLIRTLFPAAPIIHCRRDPLDVCLSNYFGHFAEPKVFTNDLADLGHFYIQYERLMAYWGEIYPDTIFHIDYGSLIDDQEGLSRKLISYCGLEWQKQCLSFHKTERHVATASRLQVRRPLYSSSVQRWRNYERFLGPLQAALIEGGHNE